MSAFPPNLRLAVAALAVAWVGTGIRAQQTALPKQSPFLPPEAAAAPTSAVSETIEFAGVSSVGKHTDLIFHNKSTKKSHWIGLGETKEGITVLNYDDRREQAVIKLNGAEKILSLRKGTSKAAPGHVPMLTPAPMPVPVPVFEPAAVAPAPIVESPVPPAPKPEGPPIPEAQLKQETEARMLVSDLLEIGMAQRRAYEEAQRKSAENSNGAAPAPEAPPPPEE